MSSKKKCWIFFRSLSTMVSAGIPLHRALQNVGEQQGDDDAWGRLANQLSEKVQSGYKFSDAVRLYPESFSKFHFALIRVAEGTGGLDVVLRRLAEYEEKVSGIRQMLVSKLTYPAFLLVMALAMLIFLPAYALEGLFQVIESSGGELPMMTTIFISGSRLLRSPITIFVLIIATVALVAAFKKALQSREYEPVIRRTLFSIPVLGEVLRISSLAVFADALALQLEVGVNPLQAISSAAQVSNNPALMEEANLAVSAIEEGDTIGGSFEQSLVLTPMFRSMLKVGEESGQLPGLLRRLNIFYSEQIEVALEALSSLLEPLILLVMGVLFGFMLVSTMMPLVKLVQTL